MNKTMVILNYSISVITGIVYAVCLVLLFVNDDYKILILSILNPAIGVIICSIIRSFINAPRPYEVSGDENLIGKKTAGKSFPSRHVFSIFVIATTVLKSFFIPGAILLALGVVLCVLRVKAKVHFVRDVLAGALSGIAVGAAIFLF